MKTAAVIMVIGVLIIVFFPPNKKQAVRVYGVGTLLVVVGGIWALISFFSSELQ